MTELDGHHYGHICSEDSHMGEKDHHKEEILQVWETGKSPQDECAHCGSIAHHLGGSVTFSTEANILDSRLW